MRKSNKNRIKPIKAVRRFAERLTAVLLSAAILLGSVALLSANVSAASYGDPSTSPDDNTYALQVSTGAVSATGNLADEILYFKIVYTDVDDYTRTHRIFPGEDALNESMTWASENGTTTADTQKNYLTSSTGQSTRESLFSKLKITVNENKQAFRAYSTDTFFFQPVKAVKSIQSIEVLMCDKITSAENVTNGTWSCQGMRIYKVSSINGVGRYGYVSDRKYASFSGTLIAAMTEPKNFNWSSDRLFKVVTSGTGDASLSLDTTAYSTETSDKIIRLDIADIYGGGIKAMANNTKKKLLLSDIDECAAITVRYTDIYGATREAYVPFMTGITAYALEMGIPETEFLSGLAQDGDTVALMATLPDLKSVDYIRFVYGTEAAKAAVGITTDVSTSSDKQDRTVNPSSGDSDNTDTLSITGFSIYDGKNSSVEFAVADTKLCPTFKGSPELYYRAPSVEGTTIRPVNMGDSGTEITLTKYENGARLLPTADTERYLIALYTDKTELAGTTGDILLTFKYVDTSGKSQTSEQIVVSDRVKQFYGDWPGVSSGFMYRVGVQSGGTVYFTVSLKNVKSFIGSTVLVRGTDDWQMQKLEIYKLETLGTLKGEWKACSDGTETSDRTYARAFTGTKMSEVSESILVDGGQDPISIEYGESSTPVIDTDTGDWSDSRYSMSYETAQTIGSFSKSRCSYVVSVVVGSDQTTAGENGDCGSKNQFYFQLVFEDGKSSYVLANQQLASDGFRAGFTEQFTISTNRDMGELTAIKILPEDTSEDSDVFDKLKIDSITVQKQTTSSVSRQWTISNIGWIDINFQDDAADSSSDDYKGRSESDVVKTYQVESSTYAVNLEFGITTGTYNTISKDETEPQFSGQVYAVIEYYNSNGVLKTRSYNLVEAMYAYSGQSRITGKTETIGQSTWPGGTESDPNTMFRAGKTDRFTLAIEDAYQLVRVTLEVRSKVATTWNISSMYAMLVGNDGRRIINTQNEYQWVYSNETEPLCCSTRTGEKAYSINLPVNQIQTATIEFGEHNINRTNAASEITSVTTRQPRSIDDTVNIYVYTTESSTSQVRDGVTMNAGIQYSRIYGGFSRVETALKSGESNGKVIFTGTGVSVSGIDTVNKLDVLAYFNNLSASGQVMLDYAVVQQVRSGVVISTFYFDFSNCDAANDSNGVSKEPQSNPTSTGQAKQIVTLMFGNDSSNVRLTNETDDLGVALIYTTNDDTSGREYESSLIYLTDQNISEIKAGRTVSLTFNEAYIDNITGIRIRGTGSNTRSGISVDCALVTTYNVDSVTGEDTIDGSYSFADGITLSAGKSNQIMNRTEVGADGRGSVSKMTLTFTVPDTKDVPAAANNATGNVGLEVSYYNTDGVSKTMWIYDVCKVAKENSASFMAGSTVTLELLVPNAEEIRYLTLSPTDASGNDATLKLSSLTAVISVGEDETTYRCDLTDWSGSGVISLFSSVQVELSASTTTPSTGEKESFTVASGQTKRQLVESGQEVTITPSVSGSTRGYTYRVERFKDEYTSTASDVVTSSGSTLKFKASNEYSAGTGTEIYYRITVSSVEVPSVQTVIEFVVEPQYKTSSATETQSQTENNDSVTE